MNAREANLDILKINYLFYSNKEEHFYKKTCSWATYWGLSLKRTFQGASYINKMCT